MITANQPVNETPDGTILMFTLPSSVQEVILITQGGLVISPDLYTIIDPGTITFAEAPIPENGELRVLGFIFGLTPFDVTFYDKMTTLINALTSRTGV